MDDIRAAIRTVAWKCIGIGVEYADQPNIGKAGNTVAENAIEEAMKVIEAKPKHVTRQPGEIYFNDAGQPVHILTAEQMQLIDKAAWPVKG